MLYVTTRNHQDAYTANQVLTQNRGVDGGLFVPLHFPKLSEQEIVKLSEMSFGQCVAEMLNLLFSLKLTGWDVDFCIGRYPVRIEQLTHRIMMTETWHNPQWQYRRMEDNLKELIHSKADVPGNWATIAIRMAVLAAILGKREILGKGPVDISAVCGDFSVPISAWYLRKMGFPVGNIICCCNENNQFWELLCTGQFHTDCISISTFIPEADITLPVNLERLISDCAGVMEADHYQRCCKSGVVYSVSDGMLQQLRHGLYASVISSSRVETAIPNVYKTHCYVMSPASSLAYSGLLDYRAKTGITRTAIVLCNQNPICDADAVATAMEIPIEELKKRI